MADEVKTESESINTAVTGLKNELNRLHQLHQKLCTAAEGGVAIHPEPDTWTRIIVIQEVLLNLTRAYTAKIEKETEGDEKSLAGGSKQLPRPANSRSRRMRK